MSKHTLGTGGIISRCTFTSILLTAILAITFSVAALALDHGISIGKTCGDTVRTCIDNDSCTDPDFCTVSECDTSIDHTADCTFFVENADTFLDSITVTNVLKELQSRLNITS